MNDIEFFLKANGEANKRIDKLEKTLNAHMGHGGHEHKPESDTDGLDPISKRLNEIENAVLGLRLSWSMHRAVCSTTKIDLMK